MIRFLTLSMLALSFSVIPAAADTVKGVLMDAVCSADFSGDYAAAKEKAKSCDLMKHGKKGFVIVQEDGQVLKMDAKGNTLMMKTLQYSNSDAQEVVVEAEGKVKGEKISVDSIRIS